MFLFQADLCIPSTERSLLRFTPFTSFVNSSFWFKFTDLKLNEDMLNEVTRHVWGYYSSADKSGSLMVDCSSFNTYHLTRVCFSSSISLFLGNTEDFIFPENLTTAGQDPMLMVIMLTRILLRNSKILIRMICLRNTAHSCSKIWRLVKLWRILVNLSSFFYSHFP